MKEGEARGERIRGDGRAGGRGKRRKGEKEEGLEERWFGREVYIIGEEEGTHDTSKQQLICWSKGGSLIILYATLSTCVRIRSSLDIWERNGVR